MRYEMSKRKTFSGYALYTILIAFGLLFFRFPSDAYRDYFQATTDSINPQYQLMIEEVYPYFPFSLKLSRPNLSLKANPDMKVFIAESLLIKPDLGSFFKEQSGYYFDCLAYDGDLKGSIHFEKNNMKAPFSTSIVLKNIYIDDFLRLSDLIGNKVRGVLDGSIAYRGVFNSLTDGIGEVNLKISDGHLELFHPILDLKSIDFDEMLMKMTLENRKIDFASVELKGKVIQGALSGTVSLRKKVSESHLNLKGTIMFLADPDKRNKNVSKILGLFLQNRKSKKLSFIIHGTLTEPKLRFI